MQGPARAPRSGVLLWLLVCMVVLGIGSFWPSSEPTEPLGPMEPGESDTFGIDSEGRGLARFRPGGRTLGWVAAAPRELLPAADGCLMAGQLDKATSERAGLSRLFETLGRSPTGANLLREAAARGVRVCVDRTTNLLAYYFANMNVIGVSWALSEGGRVIFLAHELAHIPQHPRYSDNRYFPPTDLVLLRRVREAVAEATATRIAWELSQVGFTAAWKEKLVTPYADVAKAFARTVVYQAGTEVLALATRAAFDQWFAVPWRRDVYDRMTIAHLQRIATDSMGLVPARRAISDRFLERIGRLGGENFLAGASLWPLTGAYYAGNLSLENARHIKRLGQLTEASRRPSFAQGGLADGA
ncbi:MAG: DUF6782 family putative metallopeptidase [Alphaproteobacteria bacterium]